MEKYHDTVAENPKVEMIHISLDRSEDAAEQWAAMEKFPWYTVMMRDLQRAGFDEYKTTNAVPEYALLSAEGERLGSGSQVFSKVAELTAEHPNLSIDRTALVRSTTRI